LIKLDNKNLLNDIILDDYFILKEKFTKEAVKTTYGMATLVMKIWFWWLADNDKNDTSNAIVEKEKAIINKINQEKYTLVIKDFSETNVLYDTNSIEILLPKEMINKMDFYFCSSQKLEVGKEVSISLKSGYTNTYALKGFIKYGEVIEDLKNYKYIINLPFYHAKNINSAKAILVYYKSTILNK
jgi:hypothetical protein